MLKIAVFCKLDAVGRKRFQPRKKWKKQEFPTWRLSHGVFCVPPGRPAPRRGGVLPRPPRSHASGGPISFSSGKGCFAPRRDPLLPTAAKVGKNAVQTCGLKIRPRPAQYFSRLCVPHGRGKAETTRNVESTYFSERCPFALKYRGLLFYRFSSVWLSAFSLKWEQAGVSALRCFSRG